MGLLHFCIECRNDLSIIEGGQSYIHIVSLGPVMTPNARGEPRPEAAAERRLLGVGSSARLCENSLIEPMYQYKIHSTTAFWRIYGLYPRTRSPSAGTFS